MTRQAAAWSIAAVVGTAPVVAYAVVANRDERVPEEFHIRFNQLFAKVSE